MFFYHHQGFCRGENYKHISERIPFRMYVHKNSINFSQVNSLFINSRFQVYCESEAETVSRPAPGFQIFADSTPPGNQEVKPTSAPVVGGGGGGFAIFTDENLPEKNAADVMSTAADKSSPAASVAGRVAAGGGGAFSVFSDDSQSAFRPPPSAAGVSSLSKPQASSAFSVFSDENQPPPPPTQAVRASAFTVYNHSSENQQPVIDKVSHSGHHMEIVKRNFASLTGNKSNVLQ